MKYLSYSLVVALIIVCLVQRAALSASQQDHMNAELNCSYWRSSYNVQREIIEGLVEAAKKPAPHYMLSHLPRAGEPWILEKYWVEEELWIRIAVYYSRDAAEDVRRQLESGTVRLRDLIQ